MCTDERRHGPGREQPPRSPTGTEYGQGRGGGARGEAQRAMAPQRADAGTQTVTEQDVQVAIPQEHTSERIMEQTVDAPCPQALEGIVDSECVAAAPAAARRRRTGKYMAPAPAAAYAAPATVKEYVASSPAAVIEYVAFAPAAAYTAPVNEYVPSRLP